MQWKLQVNVEAAAGQEIAAIERHWFALGPFDLSAKHCSKCRSQKVTSVGNGIVTLQGHRHRHIGPMR